MHTYSFVKFKPRGGGEKYKHRRVLLLFPLHSLISTLSRLKGQEGRVTANFTLLYSPSIKADH